MARLPDGSAFGALPSALSNRPIATYDVSGYARGAAAMAEGVSDLGKGISRAAGGFEDMQSRAARGRLDKAKANASFAIKSNEIRSALAQESDPDAVATAYPEQFRNAFADAGAHISDPQTREVWGLERSTDRDGEIAASLDQSAALRQRQEVQSITAQLDMLRTLALDKGDEATRDGLIGAGHKLIAGLEDTGLVDEAGGRALRESWTRKYATERLGRLPPEERIRLLQEGQGTVAEFIPEDQRQELMRFAQADVTDAQRKSQSDAALTQYTTRQAIDDDLGRVQATSRGRDDLIPQQIDAALGSEVRRAWQAQRDDARTIWALTHDLSTLTDEEIDKRVASATPKGGEIADSGDRPTVAIREQAIFDQVSARAAQLRELRRTDPAQSVADDPNVRVAAEEFDPQRLETAKTLIDARLAAQERAGIAKPSVLTLAESKDLLRPLSEAAQADAASKDGQSERLQQAQEQFTRQIEGVYGARAEDVLHELATRMTDKVGETAGPASTVFSEKSIATEGFDKSLFLPAQFAPPIAPAVGAGAAAGGVAAANAKANAAMARAMMSAIKGIPDAARRGAAYAELTARLLSLYLQATLFKRPMENQDGTQDRTGADQSAGSSTFAPDTVFSQGASGDSSDGRKQSPSAPGQAAGTPAGASNQTPDASAPVLAGAAAEAQTKEFVDDTPLTPEEKERLIGLAQGGAPAA